MTTTHETLLSAVMMGTLVWIVAYGPTLAGDPCWDDTLKRTYGALPPEVGRCEREGKLLMKQLQEIRANPSILTTENEKNTGHGGLYNSVWDCCKKFLGYRCQHYPPPANNPEGYGSTKLEGALCPLANLPLGQLEPANPLDKKGVFEKPGTGVGDFLKGKP